MPKTASGLEPSYKVQAGYFAVSHELYTGPERGVKSQGNPGWSKGYTCSITSLLQRALTLFLQSRCSNGTYEARFCRERSNMLSQQIYWQAMRLTNPCSASVPDLKKGSYLSFSSLFSFFPVETIQWMRLLLQIVLAALKQHFHLILYTDHLHRTHPIWPSSASCWFHDRHQTFKYLIRVSHSPTNFCSLWNGIHFHRPSAYRHAATCTLPLQSSPTPCFYFIAQALMILNAKLKAHIALCKCNKPVQANSSER